MAGRAPRLTARPKAGTRAFVAAVCAATLLSGCTTATHGRGTAAVARRTSASSATTSSTAPSSSSTACPTTYAAPDPHRPVVALAFVVSNDLASVTGTEHISFTPDLPITELVFRLTANTTPTVAEGNSIHVDSARADHGGRRADVQP